MPRLLIVLILFFNLPIQAQPIESRAQAGSPSLGVNLLFLDQQSDQDKAADGLRLQETEIQLSADVDVHFTAKVLLAIENEEGEYGIAPEEAYIETLSLPYVTLKVGKYLMPMGKHNQLHTHAFPFIDEPLQNAAIFGEEGFNEAAIGVSGLLPLPWFSELAVEFAQGDNAKLFNSPNKSDKITVGRFKNLWDLSDATTLELGLSAAQGAHDDGGETQLTGADITLKWRPVEGGRAHSFEWATEWLQQNREAPIGGKIYGIVSHLKYQVSQKWWLQYRYDQLHEDGEISIAAVGLAPEMTEKNRHTALIAFAPSEFSGLRLQYETVHQEQVEIEKRLSLQFSVSLGAHPAHAY